MSRENRGDDDEANYEVGYAKPPKHTQFKKGMSGNPKGRARGVQNFETDVRELLAKKIRVTVDGKIKIITLQKAILEVTGRQAIQGQKHAVAQIFAMAAGLEDKSREDLAPISADDAELIEIYNARLLTGAVARQEASAPEPNTRSTETPAPVATEEPIERYVRKHRRPSNEGP